MDNEIKSMPMVPLRGMTILPEMVVHFDVSRQRSIAAVQEAMAEGQEIFLVTQRSIDTEDPDAEDVFEIGTADHPSSETDPAGPGCGRTQGTPAGDRI